MIGGLMRKTIIFTIIATLIASSFMLYSGKKDRQALYMNALTEKDQVKKFGYLEEYFNTYCKKGKKKKYVTSTLLIQLVNTSLSARKFDKTEYYAEIALANKKLTATDKLDVKLALVKYFGLVKKDQAKMEKVANEIKAFDKKESIPSFNQRYLTQIQKVQIAMTAGEKQTAESTKASMLKAIEIYEKNDSAQNAKIVDHFASRLYDEFDSADDAIMGLEKICASKNADIKYIDKLAKWYRSDDIYEKASKYMIRSYEMKPDSKKAYDLGRTLSEIDIDKALAYYAEGIVRNTNSEIVAKCQERLAKLYKDEKGDELSEEQLKAEIEKIIEAAKGRLKKS